MGAKYIEKLVQLVGLQDKKARATPELVVAMVVPKSLMELEEATTMQLQLAPFCTSARTGHIHTTLHP